MKYTVTFRRTKGFFAVKTKGKMSSGGFLGMAAGILKHPGWSAHDSVLFDHRDLDFTVVPVSVLNDIRAFHLRNEKRIGNGKSAIVVGRGLREQWRRLWSRGRKIKTGNKTALFEEIKKATDWIEKREKAR